MTPQKTRLACAIASLLLPVAAFAQTTTPDSTDAKQKAVQLGTVAVTSQTADVGYTKNDATAGTKTNTALIDTAQAISVVSAAQLRDQGVLTVQDALRYSAGVRAEAYGVDSRGDDAFLRGTSFSQYLDGLRQYFGGAYARTEPYFLDHIEIVRGPSSVLYGQGTTGGLIALNSKLPQSTPMHEVDVQFGNHARKQIAFDFTGPLDTQGHWSYRLIGVARDAHSQVDYTPDDRKALAPSITWTPDKDTRWTVLTNLQFDRNGSTLNFLPHSGTLLPNPNGPIPANRNTSEPSFDRYNTDQRSVTSLFEHRFNETWKITQNLRYTRDNVDYRALYPNVYSNPENPFLDEAQREVSRYSYVAISKHRRLVADTNAQADFSTGPVHHRVLIGLDAGRSHTDSVQGSGFDATPFDLYAPTYNPNFVGPATARAPSTETRQVGAYVQDQLEWNDHWLATVGLRHDAASTKTEGSDRMKDQATTSRFGLMYKFDNGIVPYVSYTESFQPLDTLDFYNHPYAPLRGKQYEAGVKYQPVGSQSLFTATWYDLREENRLAPDPTNPLNQIQAGRMRTHGVELEGSTRIADHLDLLATYTWTNARPDDGTIVAGLPKNQASVWGVYHVNSADGDGLSFGAGARYIGRNTDETGTLHVPQKTLFDVMAAYDMGPWRISLNIANLTNQIYPASCLARGDCFMGPRRSIVGNVRYRF
ncbi:iron complex outermembrane receptor protein [Luteibacter sp. Sphag1AF]|uniref:TonB-dependent siderophore receptor n=1 Tax=Luteibacter sp. Sphag1AF TaxID=2587031 RepID=UPI0016230B31|nr:TonB-dependent siderophore receptor [Luteibacter sp. Sphag1AF]MBB3225946.1 iron complex outermembrane receptor protein [Luteibacter sp. Sphag1AF]